MASLNLLGHKTTTKELRKKIIRCASIQIVKKHKALTNNVLQKN